MNENYIYDVAISFAEEDRDAAKSLSLSFKMIGINAYYYPDERTANLGLDLEERLTQIYADEARFAVVLFSENYLDETKTYTKIELSAIQSRMQKDAGIVYMIPVKLKKELSLEKYPEINSLTFADWEYKPEYIAGDISKLLGKKLANPTDVTDGNCVIYNSGANPTVIIDDEISEINLSTLKKLGGGSVVIINQDAESFKFSKLKKAFYGCPFCGHENEFEKYGINECKKCKCSFYIPSNDFTILQYKTIGPDETKEFNKIRAHIVNNIIDKKYDIAKRYCLTAEKIAPAEYATWEHFALTEFLILIYAPAKERFSSNEIIKEIRPHLEKCKKHGVPDEKLDGLLIEIANKLFEIEKARIRSLRPSYIDTTGNEIWTRNNLFKARDYLNSFEVCYSLSENIIFLEEYVIELSKPYKWLIKTNEGNIMHTTACGGFFAEEKYKSLVTKIQTKKPDYMPPEIAEERIVILHEECLVLKSLYIFSD